MTPQVDGKAPDFELPTDDGQTITLSDYAGQWLVLYFYPKDDTSGCTKQACGFSANLKDFNQLDCAVLGVSKDSIEKHVKFKKKYDLTFPLGSDENGTVCEDYGVWTEKSMYGKKYMGIERTTFLIDGQGIIRHIWNKVKVADHIEDVLKILKDNNAKTA